MTLPDLLAALNDFKNRNPNANKADVEAFFIKLPGFTKFRSVFVCRDYVIRFSEANVGSFSNVVLSLSTLKKYDYLPVVVCIVRPNRLDFRLCNSTFLKRISHSSHQLTNNNIKGSFLGHDIIDSYEGIQNSPIYFEQLMSIHSELSWLDNVERLVEATNGIIARSTRYAATPNGIASILEAPARAHTALDTQQYRTTEDELSEKIISNTHLLLQAANIDNVNIRGNAIEQIITGTVNAHRLDDLVFPLANGGHLVVDIKTKLLDRASAPKAYNIDKMLSLLSQPGTVFAFFFIGLHVSRQICTSRLVSIFDPVIINGTRVQTLWAGRASRGVTQLTGDISLLFDPDYNSSVDIKGGIQLLRSFIER
jgi:hypothetical protein